VNLAEKISAMKTSFHKKYPYLSDEQLEDLYECSCDLYLSLSFPFNHEITEIPEEYVRDITIVRKIMEETLERDGFSSFTAYSENGMSFTFDNANISSNLLRLIVPKAKVVRKK